jgi:hypothetical protein
MIMTAPSQVDLMIQEVAEESSPIYPHKILSRNICEKYPEKTRRKYIKNSV